MSSTKHKVVWSGDEPPAGQVKKSYEELLDPMAKDFDIDINLIVCHGKKELVPEMDFEKFYIFSMIAPETVKTERDKIKELVFGGKKWSMEGGQADILKIVGDIPKGVEIIKDEADTPIAMVYDASLYFLSDFPHCKNKEQLDRSLATFRYVVDQATKTDELFRSLKAGAEEKGKRALEHALSKQFKDRLKKEESALSSAMGLYEKYTTNLTDAQRKIIATEAIISAIQQNISHVPKALQKKWDSVKKLEGTKMYESISFQRNCLKAKTTMIYVQEQKKTYRLGEFEVILSFDGNIKIHSLFKDRGVAQDHPHISSGNPCWGNMNGEPQKRIAESEFDVALVEIYTFLNHYSKDGGPYADIGNWPEVSKEDIKKETASNEEPKKEEEELSIG